MQMKTKTYVRQTLINDAYDSPASARSSARSRSASTMANLRATYQDRESILFNGLSECFYGIRKASFIVKKITLIKLWQE